MSIKGFIWNLHYTVTLLHITCQHFSQSVSFTICRNPSSQACLSGLRATLITYTSLIKAAARTGDLSGAEAWLEHACNDGLKLDIQIFTAVIDAAARTWDLKNDLL